MTPNAAKVVAATKYLDQVLTLRLFSNNHTPAVGDTLAAYTEITGGGYAAKTLAIASWVIVSGNPTIASYASQDFAFTGVTGAPATIYGYYITDTANVIRGAQRFSELVVPFSPINGALIRVTPRLQVS